MHILSNKNKALLIRLADRHATLLQASNQETTTVPFVLGVGWE